MTLTYTRARQVPWGSVLRVVTAIGPIATVQVGEEASVAAKRQKPPPQRLRIILVPRWCRRVVEAYRYNAAITRKQGKKRVVVVQETSLRVIGISYARVMRPAVRYQSWKPQVYQKGVANWNPPLLVYWNLQLLITGGELKLRRASKNL